MKITGIKTRLLHAPVETALINQTKSVAYMEIILVEVATDEGITGYGYTYTDGFGGHAIKTLIDTDVTQLLVGKDPLQVKALSKFLLWELRQAGFAGITVLGAAGVDLALWDIFSKASGLPLTRLLGQYRESVPMYASVAGWIGLPVDEMVARAKDLYEANHMLGVKIQVGRADVETDAMRLEKLRLALGREAKLFIDANTLLDIPAAVRLAERVREYDIFWLEEPLPLRDVMGHRLLARKVDIPLATGENFFGIHDCDEYIRERAVEYIQADVIRVGGITEWLRIASYCDAQGIRISPHFVMEVTAHVQCCVPNSLFVEYIPWFQKYFEEPVRVENGHVYPRTEPGLGLKFREDAIARTEVE